MQSVWNMFYCFVLENKPNLKNIGTQFYSREVLQNGLGDTSDT